MDGVRKGEQNGSNMRRLVLFLALVASHGAAHTFGGTDALGWTDTASYEGSEYTASRVAATVARESLITAATLGVGTAARGGSAAAQTAYKGILMTEAATGGYQIGKGGVQIAEGDYGAGTLNVVAGGLRVGGSIAGAGAVKQTSAPAFIVSRGGTVYPVPQGASGPIPATSGKGIQFTGGSGGHGLSPNTTDIRIMDPITSGKYQYPGGYGSYGNAAGQIVNPLSGQTIPKSDPWWHIPAE